MNISTQHHNNRRQLIGLLLLGLNLYLGSSAVSADLVTTYEYDAEDNMIAMVDAKGQRFEYDYDELNRLSETRYHDAASNFYKPVKTNTSYDPNNNPISIIETKLNDSGVEFSDVCTMDYDLLDRMTQKIQRGYTIDTAYDDNGNKTAVTTNGGSTAYTFDTRNRLKLAIQDGNVTTYTYRGDNLQTQVEYPNNTETVYTYDTANRSKTVVNQTTGISNLISSYSYDYDLNGNRTEQLEQQPNMPTTSRTTTYSYDNNDRMLSYIESNNDNSDNIQYTYEYDAAYNRTKEIKQETLGANSTTTSRSYSYDETHWLTQIEEDNDPEDNEPGKTIDYSYDENGNTLTKVDNTDVAEEQTNFYYDSRNQLVQLTRGPPLGQINQGRYDYDYKGIRVRHIDSERGDVEYYHDGNSIIDEYINNNTNPANLLAHYNYADRLLSLKTPTSEQYYHYSALRTTTNLTDNTGATQVSYHTNPWGEITEQQGSSVNRQVFTGQEHDLNTGLIYFGARYYDSDTARFITQDNYLGDYSNPPSLHRYLYTSARPTFYIDRNGHCFGLCTGAVLAYLAYTAANAEFEGHPLELSGQAGKANSLAFFQPIQLTL